MPNNLVTYFKIFVALHNDLKAKTQKMSNEKVQVSFHLLNTIENNLLKYAVICSFKEDKIVCVRHRARQSWEIPGGRREKDESIDACAVRELIEETGAEVFDIHPLCDYGVVMGEKQSYGRLYMAEIKAFGTLPDSEIAESVLLDHLPELLTYPEIQPKLLEKALEIIRKQVYNRENL
jgi:8-oxo-dGTP diphosphatase